MRGIGFECDQCGTRIIFPGGRWDNSSASTHPDGWVFIADTPGSPGAVHDGFELCSWTCAAAFTTTKTIPR